MDGPLLTWLTLVDELRGSRGLSTSTAITVGVKFRLPSIGGIVEAQTSLLFLVPLDASALGVIECLETRDTKRLFLNLSRPSCNPRLSRGSCLNRWNVLKAWCAWKTSNTLCEEVHLQEIASMYPPAPFHGGRTIFVPD